MRPDRDRMLGPNGGTTSTERRAGAFCPAVLLVLVVPLLWKVRIDLLRSTSDSIDWWEGTGDRRHDDRTDAQRNTRRRED